MLLLATVVLGGLTTGGVADEAFAASATLQEIDGAVAALLAARARRFPGAAPSSNLPVCPFEAPITSACIDPCPACLGYPSTYPENQTFHAWAVFSRPTAPWPAEDINTGLHAVDENNAAIGPGDEIVVQGVEALYSSTDEGKTWGSACIRICITKLYDELCI